MNPNSANQWWSKWTFIVFPQRPHAQHLEEVTTNCARFGRKAFGGATEMRVREVEQLPPDIRHLVSRGITRRRLLKNVWIVEVRTEGESTIDQQYVTSMGRQWTRFFREGFGQQTQVEVKVKHEAGSRQDGTPADQLIMLPPMAVEGVV